MYKATLQPLQVSLLLTGVLLARLHPAMSCSLCAGIHIQCSQNSLAAGVHSIAARTAHVSRLWTHNRHEYAA